MEEIMRSWPGWEVVRKIGSGSFGSVYEIRRDLFGKTESAALKVLSIPESQEEIEELYNDGYDDESITTHYREYLGDIIREYSLMLEMKGHTNVVYCDDVKYVQHADGIGWDIYIKMELLTPLTMAVGKYDEAQTVRLGIDLCSALMLCKQEGIVHRDIKPQNIFVSKTGDYKLGDFGVAKITDKTATGTKVGTFDYMAPEVYRGQAYGSGVDIYSLGLVLYWMMNRKKTPFLPLTEIPSASIKEEARNRRFSGEALPAPANGSEALKRIVLRACAFDPKDRYQSAAEMRAELLKLRQGEPAVYCAGGAPEEAPEEGTVSIFNAATEPQQPAEPVAAPAVEVRGILEEAADQPYEEGTVGLFAGEVTEYAEDAATEYIRDEATVYVPRPEKPERKKGLLPLILGLSAIVIVILLLLRSCGGRTAGPGDTTGSEPGTTQTDGTTAPEDTTAPTTGETTVPPAAEESSLPTTSSQPAIHEEVVLTEISIAALPKICIYYVGNKLDTSGLTLKLQYSDGSTETITSGFLCNPTTLNTAGTQTITASYKGKTTSFEVSVEKPWSSWVSELPENVNSSYYEIEEKTQYSYYIISEQDWVEKGSWLCSDCALVQGEDRYVVDSVDEYWDSCWKDENNEYICDCSMHFALSAPGTMVGGSTSKSYEDVTETATQYRYRDLIAADEYGEWSAWQFEAISSSETREVEKRTVYRYGQIVTTATHYHCHPTWSDYGDTFIEENDDTVVRIRTMYRYREK